MAETNVAVVDQAEKRRWFPRDESEAVNALDLFLWEHYYATWLRTRDGNPTGLMIMDIWAEISGIALHPLGSPREDARRVLAALKAKLDAAA
jgi:hypothetical protein